MTRKPPVKLDPNFNPGNARWCETHKRMECVKMRSRGRGTCHQPATRGTDSCKNHAGIRKDVAKARGQAAITAWSAVGDITKAIDHKMAVLGVLQMSWLRLAAYSRLLGRQVDNGSDEPRPQLEAGGPANADGLIGYKYGAAGKDGIIYAQSEEVRALVALEAAERDRVVKYAKTAHDMGISDRLTNLAEKWGDVVATRITIILSELNLTPEQQALVPALITQHLGQLEISSPDGS